jgi:hypothetical protein
LGKREEKGLSGAHLHAILLLTGEDEQDAGEVNTVATIIFLVFFTATQ